MLGTKKILFLTSTFAIAMTFLFSNCGGGKHKNGSSNEVEQSALFAYPIPTSFEITDILNNAGSSYILSITNEISNVDKYISIKAKALNLGVYSADLCYASSYNMTQEIMNYVTVSKTLLDQLDINIPIGKNIVEEMEGSNDNKDSIIIIVSESIKQTYSYLKANDRENISLLILAGSYVEGLYISSQMASLSPNNQDLMKAIAGQKVTLSALIKLIEPKKDDEELKDTYESLKKIETFYGDIIISISEEQLFEIAKLSEEIRNKFIE